MVQSAKTIEKGMLQKDNNIEALTYHQEIICSLDLSGNSDAKKYQAEIAKELAHTYEHGAKGVKSNKWKAKKYAQMAGLKTPVAELQETVFKTENVYSAFSLFNDFRLFAVRFVNILMIANVMVRSVFNTVLSAMGLFFALRLAFDLSMVFKGTFFPAGDAEKELSPWERFKAVMKKDDRMYRMANDVVWFSINFLAMCFTGGLSVAGVVITTTLMNISGFAFDTFAEVARWREIQTLEHALAEIAEQNQRLKNEPKLVALLDELKRKEEQREVVKAFSDFNSANPIMSEQEVDTLLAQTEEAIASIKNTALYREHVKFNQIETALTQRLTEAKRDRLRVIGIVAMVCVGAALTLFPMTLPVGIVMLGGVVSFLGGSVFNGLGHRISKWFKAEAKPVDKTVSQQQIVPNANALFQQAIEVNSYQATVQEKRENNVIPFPRRVQASPSHYGLYSHHHEVEQEEPVQLKRMANVFN